VLIPLNFKFRPKEKKARIKSLHSQFGLAGIR
jgi:hypothetical protein